MGDNYLWRGQAEGLQWSDSGLALLVRVDGETHWIPDSAIHEDSEVYKPGTEGELVIPQRLAEEKGIC